MEIYSNPHPFPSLSDMPITLDTITRLHSDLKKIMGKETLERVEVPLSKLEKFKAVLRDKGVSFHQSEFNESVGVIGGLPIRIVQSPIWEEGNLAMIVKRRNVKTPKDISSFKIGFIKDAE